MDERKLLRSKKERMIGGVCSGLAIYLNVDPTIIRLVFVLSTLLLFQWLALVYVLMLIIIPEES